MLSSILFPPDGRSTSSWKQRVGARHCYSLCNVVLNEITLPSLSSLLRFEGNDATATSNWNNFRYVHTLGSSCIDYSMRQWQRMPCRKGTLFSPKTYTKYLAVFWRFGWVSFWYTFSDSVYVFPGFLLQQHKHLLASDVHSAVKPKPKMQCQYPPSPSTGSIAKAAKKNQPG